MTSATRTVDLSIVVVTWNVSDHTVHCLETIEQTKGVLQVETIVVDNASTDDTVGRVRGTHPGTILIENSQNVGFARAANQAIQRSVGRQVLLLNPDTRVMDGALQELVRVADELPAVGVVGPKVVSPDGSIQLVCGRAFPTVSRWFFYYSFLGQLLRRNRSLSAYLMSYWDHTSSRDVEAVCGAAMLIPRRTIDEIGPLDESHPMYLEDLEYCWRAVRAGKRVYFAAGASIVHYGGQSSARVPVSARLLILEAQRKFCDIYGTQRSAVAFRVVIVLLSLWRLPALAAIKIVTTLARIRHPRVDAIRLNLEVVNLLWALGAMRAPTMEEVR